METSVHRHNQSDFIYNGGGGEFGRGDQKFSYQYNLRDGSSSAMQQLDFFVPFFFAAYDASIPTTASHFQNFFLV